MKNRVRRHLKDNVRRIVVLLVFFLIAYPMHKFLSSIEQEIISSISLLIIFSGVLIYEYKSLFKKNLPSYEYFINIFFIIFFTILLFGTIYSEGIDKTTNDGEKSYFIENGQITELTFGDAIYFSTTTLTTVGYGDIVPVGIFRYFAMIEIFAGLIYIGTMVFVLTKHMDGKHNSN